MKKTYNVVEGKYFQEISKWTEYIECVVGSSGVRGSIPVRSVVCCGLAQITFPQLEVYSVHMFLNSRNKSSTELMLVVEI